MRERPSRNVGLCVAPPTWSLHVGLGMQENDTTLILLLLSVQVLNHLNLFELIFLFPAGLPDVWQGSQASVAVDLVALVDTMLPQVATALVDVLLSARVLRWLQLFPNPAFLDFVIRFWAVDLQNTLKMKPGGCAFNQLSSWHWETKNPLLFPHPVTQNLTPLFFKRGFWPWNSDY